MNTQHGTFRVSIRVVRPCPVKLIIWSTNPSQREKEQMLLSVICMIFFKIMVRARKLVIFMQTTVAARIRTIMYSGTFAGGSFTDFTNMLPTLSSLQDTGNLAPIGVLGFWNRKFVEHLLHRCSTSWKPSTSQPWLVLIMVSSSACTMELC